MHKTQSTLTEDQTALRDTVARFAKEQLVGLARELDEKDESVPDEWMKRYAEIAETETALAVRGLELTVEITREAAVTLWNDEEAIIILRLGLKSADPDVANRAKRVRDAFLPEGKNQFLDLS